MLTSTRSRQMSSGVRAGAAAAASGGSSSIELAFRPGSGDRLLDALIDGLTYRIASRGGGSVSALFGARA